MRVLGNNISLRPLEKPVLLLLVLLMAGCISTERMIAVSEVPDAVLAAVRAEVPGIEITEAIVEEERGRTVYEIEGVADGIEYEFEVTADGKILEMESEEADD